MAICAKCGEAVPEDAAFCPFCSTDIAPAAPASAAVTAPRPPLAAPSPPPPPPTSTRPSSQPPPAPAVPATPPRGSSCLIVALILALVLVLTIVGVIAYLAWIGSSHPAAPGPHAQTAPIAPAPGTKPSPGQQPAPDDLTGGAKLEDFVGEWWFVGEAGPWGEGPPFKLEKFGNLLVGVAGDPQWEEKTELKLTLGNERATGESTTRYPDGKTEVMSISMELNEKKNIITLKYRADDGEWLVRVAERR